MSLAEVLDYDNVEWVFCGQRNSYNSYWHPSHGHTLKLLPPPTPPTHYMLWWWLPHDVKFITCTIWSEETVFLVIEQIHWQHRIVLLFLISALCTPWGNQRLWRRPYVQTQAFFFFFHFSPHCPQCGECCQWCSRHWWCLPPLWLSSDLSQHSCLLTEAGSCYLRIERPEYAAVSRWKLWHNLIHRSYLLGKTWSYTGCRGKSWGFASHS